MLEVIKEIRLVYYSTERLGISVTLPIMVQDDILGAIFMVDNASSCMLIRHSNTRYHFSQEQLEDGFIRTIFVRTYVCA